MQSRSPAFPGISCSKVKRKKGQLPALYRATLVPARTRNRIRCQCHPAPGGGQHTESTPTTSPPADTPPYARPARRAPHRRPPAPRAVRPAGHGAWRRPGRLHAPGAARTGPVSAFRRSPRTISRGGCQLNGKMAVNRVFGRALGKSDLGGHKTGAITAKSRWYFIA